MKTNSTQENLKKYFYTGVGHLSHASEVIQRSAKELARQGKVTEADGKKIVNDAIWELEQKYNEAVHKLAEFTRSEVVTLQDRLGKMERQIIFKTKRPSTPGRIRPKTIVKKGNHSSKRSAHMAV